MSNYIKNEELEKIAAKVISENDCFSNLNNVRIAYQYADGKKTNAGKTVYADTEKVKDKYKEFMPYDFVITFYEGNTCNLTPEKMEHLMFHELKHVGVDGSRFYLVPHDIEDFRVVIDQWGIDWI